MDQVDLQINNYIEGLVMDCLNSPNPPDPEMVRNRLYKVVVETVVAALDQNQFSQIENLDPASQEMADKIQDFASKIPGLHKIIEEKLAQEVANIKQTPSL